MPVVLIEPQERFLFLPLLYELLSHELRRWEVAPRYGELLAGKGVVWLQERVTRIDTQTRELHTDAGQRLHYGQLVLATGGKPCTYGIPGVAEHCIGFRSLADVDQLQQLVERLRQQQRPLQRIVIVGAGAVLGNACEFKHCLLLDGVQAPHFNYVGDSILGERAHLGAGVICSNLRLDQQEVTVRLPEGVVATGLRKFGAVLGDEAEVGCNAVLNPGTILGKRALVMPATAFGGYLPAATIARTRGVLQTFPRRD